MTESPLPDPAVRFLAPEEAEELTRLVRRCYGDTYDAAWVYDPPAIADRIRAGTLSSVVGATASGELVGHLGLSRRRPADDVLEAGQAVVDPAFRGHQLFTVLKRRAAEWAGTAGVCGLFSEATAAHPYSQRANVALGAVETGLLLGYIPATVEYTAIDARPHRQSVVLFYLKTNDGHRRPIYAPACDRAMVEGIVIAAGLRGVVTDADANAPTPTTSDLHVEARVDHNHLLVTARTVGADLASQVEVARTDAVARGIDCVYLDLPLADPATAAVGDAVRELGFRFGGVFPNWLHDCDVLRYQYLNQVDVDTGDVVVASPHGQALLDYVTS